MLILAGISLSGLIGEKGLFKRTEEAGGKYNEAKAREVLETVLLADGQFEKNTNPKYNQDDFLDDLIKKEIPGSDVKGDVAIIGEHAYELDRSVPKIGKYLGNPKDLVWPTVTVDKPVLATDYRSSTFTVNAIEETNGINKIEIWFAGEKIETLDKTYNNIKTQIKQDFTVNKNGVYTVKVYGKLIASVAVEVTGIVPAVEFSPNGNTEWKQSHTTKITVKETGERIISLKYKWTESSTNPPSEDEFIETCTNNSIITGKEMTGTYYLWGLLETESGKTNICGSEAFYFDNEGPSIESFDAVQYSDKGISVNIETHDSKSGIYILEFYIDNILKDTRKYESATRNITENVKIEDIEVGEHTCEIRIQDIANNVTITSMPITIKLYNWEMWNVSEKEYFTYTSKKSPSAYTFGNGSSATATLYSSFTFNEDTGVFTLIGSKTIDVNKNSISGLYRRGTSKQIYRHTSSTSVSYQWYYDTLSSTSAGMRKIKGNELLGHINGFPENAYPVNRCKTEMFGIFSKEVFRELETTSFLFYNNTIYKYKKCFTFIDNST